MEGIIMEGKIMEGIIMEGKLSTFKINDQPCSINFRNPNGQLIGELFIKDKIEFVGDTDESAALLFDYICNSFSLHIEELVDNEVSKRLKNG